jgi:hypothetical protein
MERVMDLLLPVWSRLSLAACALVLMVPAGQAALAQQAAVKPQAVSAARAGQPTAAQTETAAGETKPAKSGQEGITVHGHWVIDVRNPDGSLAQHREFENSLTLNGTYVLAALLSGSAVPGNWAVLLGPASGNGPCTNSYTASGVSGTSEICEVVQTLTTAPAIGDCQQNLCGAGLTLTLPGLNGVALTGTITANQTGTIGVVSSTMAVCLPNGTFYYQNTAIQSGTVSPSACVTASTVGESFTSTTLTTILKPGATPTPNPIPVTAGQTILASVTIGFS